MDINIIDASSYFKGLLLLIRKDRQITEPEIDLMVKIGKSLGFAKNFCENAINEILENTFIEDIPPKFSTKEIAIRFLRDGLFIAFVDHDVIHPEEEHWLKAAAVANGLDLETFSRELLDVRNRKGHPESLEVFRFTVVHG